MTESSLVIAKLLPLIRDRGYLSGERIGSERDLADRFDVSRPMLREALSVLESMRVIERRPQSGIYMRQVTPAGGLAKVHPRGVVIGAGDCIAPGFASVSGNTHRTIPKEQMMRMSAGVSHSKSAVVQFGR